MSDLGARQSRRFAYGHDSRSALDGLIFAFRSRRVVAALPARADVVADLGSGHDYPLLRYLCRTGRAKQGIAVDITFDAGRATPEIETLEADLGQPLDLPSASVDVVLSVAVLEHLDDPLLHLREGLRILRTGGRIVLTSPAQSSQWLLELLAYRLHVIDEREIRDHRRYYAETDIRRLLADAGFAAESIRYQTFLFGLNQLATAQKAGAAS